MRDAVEVRYRRARAEGRGASRVLCAAGASLIAQAALAWLDAIPRLSGIVLDQRFIRRSLARSPGFAASVIGVVAVAVALVVATAGFLRGTLFPPRAESSARLVFAWGSNVTNGQLRDVVSGPLFLDFRRSSRTLVGLAAFHPGSASVMRDGRPQVLDVLDVSVDFLRVLGVTPALGCDFGEEQRHSGGASAVLVSHAFWQDVLGADRDALGSTLLLDGAPHEILGVLRADLELPLPAPILKPLHEDVLFGEDRTFYNYWLIGRLAPGTAPSEATRELSGRMELAAREDPRLSGWSVLVEPVDEVTVAAVRPLLLAIGGAVLVVLLAAGANLAILNLVRALGRSRELFVRKAVGARRAELSRLVLLETGALVATGTILGLGLGALLLARLADIVPASIPIPGSAATVEALRARFDASVGLSGLAAAAVAWAMLAAPTLLHASRARRAPRGLRLVVAGELALATVLLVGTGLLLRTTEQLSAVDPGVDPQGLLTFYAGNLEDLDASARARYFREAIRRIEEVPGVVRAGVSDYAPFQGEDDFMGFRLEDRPPPLPGQGPREEWRRVSDGFFDAAGLVIRVGRGFEPQDFEVPPSVAVVNEAFRTKYWPGVDVLGRRMRIAVPQYRLVEVIGIVEDVPERGPAFPAPPTFFVPLHGDPRDTMAFFVRFSGAPLDSLEAVREAVWSIDATQPIGSVAPMSALVAGPLYLPRLAGSLVAQFAVLALLLAGLGLYGVVSHGVRVRRSELGVRLALGATPRRLKRDLLAELAPWALLGFASGATLGIAAGHAGRTLLFQVSPGDPGGIAATALVIAALVLLAAYLPARSVARIDPSEGIRIA